MFEQFFKLSFIAIVFALLSALFEKFPWKDIKLKRQ